MKKLLILIACVLLLLPVAGCTKSSEKVLVIFSYHPEYAWVIDEMRGVEDILKERGAEIEALYLDTKRNTSAAWMEQAAADAVKKIEEYKPDLVIVFDDNACELVARQYIGKIMPFVFAGMNGEPADYGFPAPNITGVVESHHLAATVDLLKRLVPGVEKLAIITDDSPTSRAFISSLESTTPAIEISEIFATNDYDAWKDKVSELQGQVDAIGVYVYHTIKEGAGEVSLSPEAVLQWTLDNNRLPGFGFFDFTIKDGVLCGVTESGYEQGKAAAQIAVRILDGENPGDIPIESLDVGALMINETRAKELNIEIPADVRRDVELLP